METNRVNGHQHEVSEKRLAPAAFPYRLDMEVCACGAKRWVNQDGTQATPWQFVNLGQTGEKLERGPAPKTPRQQTASQTTVATRTEDTTTTRRVSAARRTTGRVSRR